MATYEPATTEETALVLQAIRTEGYVPTGFAFNPYWPDPVRRIVSEPSATPVWSPEGRYLDARIDSLEILLGGGENPVIDGGGP